MATIKASKRHFSAPRGSMGNHPTHGIYDTPLSFQCQSPHNADNVPLRDDPDACVACSYSYYAQFVNRLGPRRRKDHSFMRGRNLGDSATVIVPSLNDAESVTDQANIRVASDTTVVSVFNRADSRHVTQCSLREYELGLAECRS